MDNKASKFLERFKTANRSELPESVKKFLEKFKTNGTNPNNIFNNLFNKNWLETETIKI